MFSAPSLQRSVSGRAVFLGILYALTARPCRSRSVTREPDSACRPHCSLFLRTRFQRPPSDRRAERPQDRRAKQSLGLRRRRGGAGAVSIAARLTSSRRAGGVSARGRSGPWPRVPRCARPPAWPPQAPCCRCGPPRVPPPPAASRPPQRRPGGRPGPPAALPAPLPPQVLFRAAAFGLNALTLRRLSRELVGVVGVR